jgi:hypothetical protein
VLPQRPSSGGWQLVGWQLVAAGGCVYGCTCGMDDMDLCTRLEVLPLLVLTDKFIAHGESVLYMCLCAVSPQMLFHVNSFRKAVYFLPQREEQLQDSVTLALQDVFMNLQVILSF